MLAKLLPVLLLLVGTGGGIGAGLFLMPGAEPDSPDNIQGPAGSQGGGAAENAQINGATGGASDPLTTEFFKLNNQFVIPVVKNDMIASLVVITLNLETRIGVSESIYAREPKLRDAFLRVLFDHANMGGFQGDFTNADTLDLLRSALRQVAQKIIGADIIDVLIVDILRQDT